MKELQNGNNGTDLGQQGLFGSLVIVKYVLYYLEITKQSFQPVVKISEKRKAHAVAWAGQPMHVSVLFAAT